MELPYKRELFFQLKKKAEWRERIYNAGRRCCKPTAVLFQVAKETLPPDLYEQFIQRYREEMKIMTHRNSAEMMEIDND